MYKPLSEQITDYHQMMTECLDHYKTLLTDAVREAEWLCGAATDMLEDVEDSSHDCNTDGHEGGCSTCQRMDSLKRAVERVRKVLKGDAT